MPTSQPATTLTPGEVLSLVAAIVGVGVTYLRLYIGNQVLLLQQKIDEKIKADFATKENVEVLIESLDRRLTVVENGRCPNCDDSNTQRN